MTTKYSWANTPLNVKWKATDKEGFEIWFESKPQILFDYFWCDVNAEDSLDGCFAMFNPSEFDGCWTMSLEERPGE